MLHTVDVTPELVRPIRRSEYHRMVAIGLFEDERVELLRGGLVSMSPQRPRHARVIQTLTRILVLALAERA
ncbi:MAG: Uma2 family endonuclease, partial [Myxococcota bacterium]